MPVTTASAGQISWINGRPVLTSKLNANTNTATTKKSTQKTPKPKTTPNPHRAKQYQCRAQQLRPQLNLVTPGSPLAFDCEGVELTQESGKRRSGVGRFSIVNIHGQVVYDTFVYYAPDVPHRPPPQHLKLGVTYKDIRPENGAQPHAEVLAAAKAIFDMSGVVVAHAAGSDVLMLDGIDFGKYVVRDTQRLYGSSLGQLPGLRSLSASVLGRSIQVTEHSSVEDARATMELFLWYHERNESDCDYAGKALDSVGTSSRVEDGSRCGGLTSKDGVSRLTNVDGL